MKFDIVIPAYNMFIKDNYLIRRRNQLTNCRIFFCDNSTDKLIRRKNKEYAAGLYDVQYLDMGGNWGLSKAYNRAVREGDGDVVCFFDDDTEIDFQYFAELLKAVSKNGSGIYVPLIEARSNILSPLRVFGPAIMRVKRFEDVHPSSISAFNTGMAITRDIADSLPHDEHFFLDFVDHSFCRDAHCKGFNFYVLDKVIFQQDYSKYSNDAESALHRQKIAIPDIWYFYKNGSVLFRIYGWMYCRWIRVRNCVKYKKFVFWFA